MKTEALVNTGLSDIYSCLDVPQWHIQHKCPIATVASMASKTWRHWWHQHSQESEDECCATSARNRLNQSNWIEMRKRSQWRTGSYQCGFSSVYVSRSFRAVHIISVSNMPDLWEHSSWNLQHCRVKDISSLAILNAQWIQRIRFTTRFPTTCEISPRDIGHVARRRL